MKKTEKNQKTHKSPMLVDLWIWLIIRFFVWTVAGCFGCVFISVFLVIMRGTSGFINLQKMFEENYHMLLLLIKPDQLIFVNHWIDVFSNKITLINSPVARYGHITLLNFDLMLSAALLALKLLVLRLYFLAHWCYLFLLIGFVGLIDGLMQRKIRRFSAGRESALIYHNAKPLIMLSLICGVFAGLALPASLRIHEWILVISVVLFSAAIQTTAKSFKKYF